MTLEELDRLSGFGGEMVYPPAPPRPASPALETKQGLAEVARAAERPPEYDGTSIYQLKNLKYSHEALVDVLVANPRVTQKELAAHFGYTEGWLSRIMRSDAFRELVAARKSELVDPVVLQSLNQQFEALAERSAEILLEKLDATHDTDTAMKALELSSKALGFGASKGPTVNVTSFVVAMPAKAASSAEWVEAHRPARPHSVIDVPAQGAQDAA